MPPCSPDTGHQGLGTAERGKMLRPDSLHCTPTGSSNFQSDQQLPTSRAAGPTSWFSGPGAGASLCPPWPEAAGAGPGPTPRQSGQLPLALPSSGRLIS